MQVKPGISDAVKLTATVLGFIVVVLLLSLCAIAHAGTCPDPPTFGDAPYVCSALRQGIECGCSECLHWDPLPGASRYEVVRTTVSTGAVYIVGVIYASLQEDGSVNLPTQWCVAMDSSFPHEGTAYRYVVRGCSHVGCGGASGSISYTGAPYACISGGREVQCYIASPYRLRSTP